MIPDWVTSGKIEPFLLPVIVVLVGVGAFGLGRLSAAQGHQALRIIYPEAQLATPVVAGQKAAPVGESAGQTQGVGQYVASRSGSKYYLTSCPGAGRIKEDNKVYFATAQEAKAAGYGPAANCPGL